MVLFFKHMAVRLWTALFFGAVTALVLLPSLAGAIGPAWMIVPGVVLFAAAFWLTGVVFAALGRHRLARLIGEAAVWERAGMDREARQALERAETTVDSFFFSPLSRRKPSARLLAQVARFQLAFDVPESASDTAVGAYLHRFPQDRDAAVKWLDRVLAGGSVTRQTHEIASRVGAAHPDDAAIQRLLAEFYINERRCDFAALQTYRQVIETGRNLPPRLIGGIADLLLSQQRTDSLALMVYLKRFEDGDRDRRLLPGIAGCQRMLHPSPLTLPLLERAAAALAEIDASQRDMLADTFLPDMDTGDERRPLRGPRKIRTLLGPAVFTALRRIGGGLRAGSVRLERVVRWCTVMPGRVAGFLGPLVTARRTLGVAKWTALGVLVVGVGWLVVSTVSHLGSDVKPVDMPPEPVAVPVTDPFTLQVAAYLKVDDAQRFAGELKGQGLDAYWTRASGGNRTWFQVRVSHFKSKGEARAYGEELKKRRIIDDYYVANYKRPDVP
jgi:hypothetical protein